jgi:hypothetical protein
MMRVMMRMMMAKIDEKWELMRLKIRLKDTKPSAQNLTESHAAAARDGVWQGVSDSQHIVHQVAQNVGARKNLAHSCTNATMQRK